MKYLPFRTAVASFVAVAFSYGLCLGQTVYYAQANQTTTTWDVLANWFTQPTAGGTNPSTLAGNSFNSQGFVLRTSNSNFTFGNSATTLILASGSGNGLVLRAGGTSSSTVANLTSAGGKITAGTGSVNLSVTNLNNSGGLTLKPEDQGTVRVINLTIGAFSGAGALTLTNGGTVYLNVSNAGGFTGEINFAGSTPTTLNFDSDLSTGGRLVVTNSLSRVALDRNITLAGLTVNGSALAPDNYTWAELNALAPLIFPAGGTGSITVSNTTSPVLNLSASHNFPAAGNIPASASSQLAGLSSLSSFQAANSADRYVYSFETWPVASSGLGSNSYTFHFDLTGDGVADQRVTATAAGGLGYSDLVRSSIGSSAASPSNALGGLRDLGWSSSADQTFTFEKPVSAVGFVYRSSFNLLLRKQVYNANNYPVSVTLTDGTVMHLGQSGVTGATIPANTNTFVGVIDSTGKGITSITSRIQGTNSSGSQYATIDDLAFVVIPEPATANPINLKSSRDFREPGAITASAATQWSSLCSLEQFRALAKANRHVYSFNTWPQAAASLGSNNYTFQFDLNADGVSNEFDQQVTVNYTGTYSGSSQLTRTTVPGTSSPSSALGGIGDVGGTAYAEHRFTFARPVSALGCVYRSAAELKLQRTGGFPVSYTLADGSTVNLGTSGALAATLAANTNTFVGLLDPSGKGITSATFRVMGSSSASVSVDDLAFVVAGPPPGNWRLILNEEFNGSTLNNQVWATGMRWAEVINNELQGFVPENVSLVNGLCRILVEKRTVSNTNMHGYQGSVKNYASGAIQSYNRWTFTYGYYEARIRMATGKGTWPAFWLMPDRGPGVADLGARVDTGNSDGLGMGHEVDIVEYMGTWKNPTTGISKSSNAIHWSYGEGALGYFNYAQDNDGNGPLNQLMSPDTQFHTYGVHWTPQQIAFYIDGKVVNRYTDASLIANAPHHLILSCALHTDDWTGTEVPIADIDAGLPCTMEIDYVKVWMDNSLPAPTEIILDNSSEAGFAAEPALTSWNRWLTALPGYYGSDYIDDKNSSKGSKQARFTPDLAAPGSGTYEVFLRWPVGANLANNVPVDIIHAGGTTNRTVNQQANGGTWFSLGTFNFTAGAGGNVLVRTGGTTQAVAVDAVRFVKR